YAHDYRYFPEPDLVPLKVEQRWVDQLRTTLPELPVAREQRFVSQYGLPLYDAGLLTQSRALADYYETAVREHPKPKIVSNWVLSELLRELPGDDEAAIAACPIPPLNLARLLALIDSGTISGKIAKDVFEKMYRSGEDAEAIVKREGLVQVADAGALAGVVDQVLAANPAAVEDWKKGKKQSLGFLVGQVMKATQGKANPAVVNQLLLERLPKS
ncbi:MAG: Asp-tRNA(Asn)/Glu-tRNA(Gln) amidotransferase GatCAB subunit B, partial [Candidatus Rokubacteria bacterium]|nr:Asp-tRNA(Asn)/Glu-tRNA(Gln) amidotransferase GatCAB subunit B [Candidatus Rokubacteria bacterium]